MKKGLELVPHPEQSGAAASSVVSKMTEDRFTPGKARKMRNNVKRSEELVRQRGIDVRC